MLKLYRDLTEGETLQAGDEKLGEPLSWNPVDPVFFGAEPGPRFRPEYRRPVDAVSREQYDHVLLRLAEERVEHGRTTHGRNTLRAELDLARDALMKADATQ